MSKKSWPIKHGKLPYNMGQDFLTKRKNTQESWNNTICTQENGQELTDDYTKG